MANQFVESSSIENSDNNTDNNDGKRTGIAHSTNDQVPDLLGEYVKIESCDVLSGIDVSEKNVNAVGTTPCTTSRNSDEKDRNVENSNESGYSNILSENIIDVDDIKKEVEDQGESIKIDPLDVERNHLELEDSCDVNISDYLDIEIKQEQHEDKYNPSASSQCMPKNEDTEETLRSLSSSEETNKDFYFLKLPTMTSHGKRKHNTLTLNDKREIIVSLQNGINYRDLMKTYNVGKSTIFNIKSKKDKILAATSSFENHNKNPGRKTLHKPKDINFDKALYDWFSLKQSEGVAISGPTLIAKAKSLKEEMNIELGITFSQGWLRSFKTRHGIKHFSIVVEKGHKEEEFIDAVKDHKEGLKPVEKGNKQEDVESSITTHDQDGNSTSGVHNHIQTNDSNKNLENINENIAWDIAEKSIETVIQFLHQNPCFSRHDNMSAWQLQQAIITKKLQNHRRVEFRR